MNRIEREGRRTFPFYGEGYCNSLSAGCILMLPPLRQTRDGYYLDPRINPGVYWHPVIITQYYGDELWSIVVCQSFAGRSLEHEFPDDEAERYHYIEINSTFVDSKDRESNKVLMLDRGKLMDYRSYAGTTSYLVELEALGKFSGMPKFWKISNLELLKERISDVGLFYQKGDPRGHPGYRGGSVTPTDVERARLARFEIQKRAKWENPAVL